MTPETFISKYGPEWKKFESSDVGRAFLFLIECENPSRSIPKGAENSNLRLTGAPVLLNEIAGYELLANMIRMLGAEPKKILPEPPMTFSEPEIS